jgi:hypothetical protein
MRPILIGYPPKNKRVRRCVKSDFSNRFQSAVNDVDGRYLPEAAALWHFYSLPILPVMPDMDDPLHYIPPLQTPNFTHSHTAKEAQQDSEMPLGVGSLQDNDPVPVRQGKDAFFLYGMGGLVDMEEGVAV